MKILSNKPWAREFAVKYDMQCDTVFGAEDGIEHSDAILIIVDDFDNQDRTSTTVAEMCREYPKSYAIISLSDDNTNLAPAGVDTLYITGQDNFQTPHSAQKVHEILNSLLGEYI